jgi:hypothetical protein
MGDQPIKIIGVYTVDESPEVRLIEIFADCSPVVIDVGQFLQPMIDLPESYWQTAYDEKYLNEDGTEVIGEYDNLPTGTASTRLAFFLHFADFGKPLLTQLLTQFGELRLPAETPMPDRLKNIIAYEPPD